MKGFTARILRVLRSGNLMTAQRGPEVREFDETFAAYNGAKHSIACGNDTAALHLAIAAAQIGVGDEIIVPLRSSEPYTKSIR